MGIKLTVVCSLVALVLPAPAYAVVGGVNVQSGHYPFVVAIGNAEGSDCGGTLIAPSVVLTAAHCVAANAAEPAKLRVLVGTEAISTGHSVAVSSVSLHPLFRTDTMRYDAALLFLEQPVTGVRTIAMADSSPLEGATVSAAGWGEIDEHAVALPDHLRRVVLTVRAKAACARGNKIPGGYYTPSMMCAGNPGRDTCAGDSGGPLVATSHGHTTIVGITSFGFGCARSAHPGVYTRVPSIRGWALGQIARTLAVAA
ncbi:MAG TPA: serine protease [Gaiellales bacterium]|nr:serine protease [Gaiellales bacterium]